MTNEQVVCFGVACPKHENCKLYKAVDGSTDEPRQATCDNGKLAFPMYEEAEPCSDASSSG